MASTAGDNRGGRGGAASRLGGQMKGQASRLADQGIAKVADLAETKKDEVVERLEAVIEVIREFADQADGQFGASVGSAVHRGGDAVEGVVQKLRDSSVGDMVDETRSVITRHPGLAIGAASVVGFVAGRILKGGLNQAAERRQAHRTDVSTEETA